MYGLGIVKGMIVTLRNFLRGPITVQYPDERLETFPRFRGQHFVWYEDRCTGCAICAKACPHGVITVATSEAEDGSRNVERYEIDTAICMFCALCVEACPFQALYIGQRYELATYQRADLYLDKQYFNTVSKEPSAYFVSDATGLPAEIPAPRLGESHLATRADQPTEPEPAKELEVAMRKGA